VYFINVFNVHINGMTNNSSYGVEMDVYTYFTEWRIWSAAVENLRLKCTMTTIKSFIINNH
jgi:hypothetical protein